MMKLLDTPSSVRSIAKPIAAYTSSDASEKYELLYGFLWFVNNLLIFDDNK